MLIQSDSEIVLLVIDFREIFPHVHGDTFAELKTIFAVLGVWKQNQETCK